MNLKLFLLLPLCLFVNTAFAQSAGKARDTVFLFQAPRQKGGNRVYIAPELNNTVRKRLFDFSLTALEKEILRRNWAHALFDTPKRGSGCLPVRQNLHGLAPNWLPVYIYKGRYHLYAPCDHGSEYRITVQPTRLLRFYMDGPALDLLQGVSKIDSKTYKVITYTCGPEGREPSLVYVHLLDKAGQLAVWEFMDEPEGNRYELRATPAGAASFPLIVNECRYNKAREWEGFDAIDFGKLLTSNP